MQTTVCKAGYYKNLEFEQLQPMCKGIGYTFELNPKEGLGWFQPWVLSLQVEREASESLRAGASGRGVQSMTWSEFLVFRLRPGAWALLAGLVAI